MTVLVSPRRSVRNFTAPAVSAAAPFAIVVSRVVNSDALRTCFRSENSGTRADAERHARNLLAPCAALFGAVTIDVLDGAGIPVFSCAGGAS